MKKKFRYEAASESGAAFLFCEYNPVMRAEVLTFRTYREMDAYRTVNPTVPVRRHLPILIELLEVESDDETLIQTTLNRMAEWYFYTVIRNPEKQ